MPPQKRTSSAAQLALARAKTVANSNMRKLGRPPAQLVEFVDDVCEADVDGYEEDWIKEMMDLRYYAGEALRTAERSAISRQLASEQIAAYTPIQRGDTLTTADRLVFAEDDTSIFYHLSCADYSSVCACCHHMRESWRKCNRRDGSVTPAWRLLGTTRFVCRYCYDKIRSGIGAKVIRD